MAKWKKKAEVKEFVDDETYVFWVVRTTILQSKHEFNGGWRSNTDISSQKHTGRLKKIASIQMEFLSDIDNKVYSVIKDYVEGTDAYNSHVRDGTINDVITGSVVI